MKPMPLSSNGLQINSWLFLHWSLDGVYARLTLYLPTPKTQAPIEMDMYMELPDG